MSEENTYTVYKHIFPNGKLYIGITSVDVKKRWKNGKGYQKHHSKVRNAIDKFGWDNILHEIVYEHLSKTEAEKLERKLILKYNTIDDKYGYNIQKGGTHHGKFTEETKRKISISKQGTKLSDDTKNKMSASRSGEKHWLYNRKMSDVHRKHLSEAHKNHPAWNKGIPRNYWLTTEQILNLKTKQQKAMIGNKYSCKPIKCIETGVIYDGCYDAYLKTNINFSNISGVCNGKRKTAGKYHWRYVDEERG